MHGDDRIALFRPAPRDRGWVLPGGALNQDEIPEDALTRLLLKEAGLRREPAQLRLLVIESVRADPARPEPAGEIFTWQAGPLTAEEWDRMCLLHPKDRRLVAPSDFDGLVVEPAMARRIRMALKAQASGTTLRLSPSH